MSTLTEVAGLTLSVDRACEQIDAALDTGNRRAFRVWCQRRTALIARRERALLLAATTEVPAR